MSEENTLSFEVLEGEEGERVDKYLAKCASDLSRARVQGLMQDGMVRCNGAVHKQGSYKVEIGDVLEISIPEVEPAEPLAENIPLDIVYEDNDLLVINKPVGMVVHPGAGNWSGTLVNALLYHCGDTLSGIGGVMGYLSSAQQIFQGFYDTGELFALYFAISAASIGAASVVNGMIVKRLGMSSIASAALLSNIITSSIMLGIFDLSDASQTPLSVYMIYAGIIFFGNGLLFGNLNAMAIEPMGRNAGTASAVIGCCQTAIAIGVGVMIGQSYNTSLYPLVIGFGVLAAISLALHLKLTQQRTKSTEN